MDLSCKTSVSSPFSLMWATRLLEVSLSSLNSFLFFDSWANKWKRPWYRRWKDEKEVSLTIVLSHREWNACFMRQTLDLFPLKMWSLSCVGDKNEIERERETCIIILLLSDLTSFLLSLLFPCPQNHQNKNDIIYQERTEWMRKKASMRLRMTCQTLHLIHRPFTHPLLFFFAFFIQKTSPKNIF